MGGCYQGALKEIEELKEKIEGMKCCGNCKHANWKTLKCGKLSNEFDCIDNGRKHWEMVENVL